MLKCIDHSLLHTTKDTANIQLWFTKQRQQQDHRERDTERVTQREKVRE